MAKFALENLKAKTAAVALRQRQRLHQGPGRVLQGRLQEGRRQGRRLRVLRQGRRRLLGPPDQGRGRQPGLPLPARLLQQGQPDRQAGPGEGHQGRLRRRRRLGLLRPRPQGRGRRLLQQPLLAPTTTRPEVQDWVKKYKAKYNACRMRWRPWPTTRPTCWSSRSWSPAADDTDQDQGRHGRDSRTSRPCLGNITFDKNGNPVKSAVVIQVKDGKQTSTRTTVSSVSLLAQAEAGDPCGSPRSVYHIRSRPRMDHRLSCSSRWSTASSWASSTP